METLVFVLMGIGIVSIAGIAVIENLLNSNLMPLSIISYGFHVVLFISALLLLVYAIVLMIKIRGDKEGRLVILGGIFVCLVILVKNGYEAADIYSIFKGDIMEYQGYTNISHRMGERLTTEYSYGQDRLKMVKYVKERNLSLDNGDRLHYRKNLKNPEYSGAAKVRYLPISGYLLDIKGLGEEYLLEQKEKLDLLGEAVNIPMSELTVSNNRDNNIYEAKCKVEIIRIVKDMRKFNEYTSQSIDRLQGNACAIKIRFTYYDFNQEGKDSQVYKYVPGEIKAGLYQKNNGEYKEIFAFIGDDFNGCLHREYWYKDGSIQVGKDSIYTIGGWLELSLYSLDNYKLNEPLYLVLYEYGQDINKNSAAIDISQYLK